MWRGDYQPLMSQPFHIKEDLVSCEEVLLLGHLAVKGGHTMSGLTQATWSEGSNIVIQVDIGGHQPIPLGAPPFSISVFQFRHSLLF